MGRPGWLNDNEFRAYPFLDVGRTLRRSTDQVEVALPDSAIVGFTTIVGLYAGWSLSAMIRLDRIARSGSTFTFTFRAAGASGLLPATLVFTRTLSDVEFASESSTSAVGGGNPCNDGLLWEGVLVTGTLDDLAALLPSGATLQADIAAPIIEPCLVQDIARSYVRTLSVANAPRLLVTPPPGCGVAVAPPSNYVVAASCLAGPIWFVEGFNCSIRQNPRDNSLTFAARTGAGAGEPCGEVPLTSTETPPVGSNLLSGGPSCGQVVTSINGLSTSVIRLVAGTGVRIIEDSATPHTLTIDFDLHDLTVCPDAT